MTARIGFACCILTLSVLGCDAETRRAAPASVRDSASVTIVENFVPAWGEGPSWRLSADPVLSIGLAGGRQEYQLHEVMGVVRLDDGRIVVAEMGSNRLRLYDAQGRHVWSAGGSGQGPGEITQTFGLLRIGDDTLAVPDARRPVHFFSTDGAYIGEFAFPSEERVFARPLGVLHDGSLLFAASSPLPIRINEPTELWMPIFRSHPATGETDSIASLLSGVVHPGPYPEPTMETFGPRLSITTVADGFYAGYPISLNFGG